jgi:hypothetical protein
MYETNLHCKLLKKRGNCPSCRYLLITVIRANFFFFVCFVLFCFFVCFCFVFVFLFYFFVFFLLRRILFKKTLFSNFTSYYITALHVYLLITFSVIERQTTQFPTEKRTKGQTMIYKTLHRKLKIEQHVPLSKLGVNSIENVYRKCC